ncbi:HNH endonuclease signature motif containing protein [Micromonospora sp. NPDC049891]|uniref:HNH endonuclease n=1 Tax=Micromonospora sp. NPDC049891 TaxID=3155655 RepID=UPI0034087AB4
MSKRCTKCGQAKPLEEFGKDRSKKGGRAYRCLACERERDRQRDPVRNTTAARREEQWAKMATQRARSFDAPAVEVVRRLDVFQADGWICYICDDPVLRDLDDYLNPLAATVDHAVALSQGGSHTMANCVTAHRRCNQSKSNLDVDDYLANQAVAA